MKNVDCRGSENDIEQCFHSQWGISDCKHAEDVGVDCCKFLCFISLQLCLFILEYEYQIDISGENV